MNTPPQLAALSRDVSRERASSIRKHGRIPAILYGHGFESQPLTLSLLDFSRVYQSAGSNTIVEIVLSGGKPINALICDVARDPLSGQFLHADLHQVRMDEAIEASIPLVFVGESAAVKSLGGILVKALDEIGVSCLPAALPHELEVDISALSSFDDQIRVSHVRLPDGVSVTDDMETVVALVERPRTDEEMAALDSKVEADVTKVEGVVKETPAAAEKS